MTIAQIVYDNELHFGLTDQDIREKVSLAPSEDCHLMLIPNIHIIASADMVRYG